MLGLLVAVSAPGLARSQEPAKSANDRPQANSFTTLVERVKKGDTTVSFTELRMAYAETKDFNPYGPDKEIQKSMFEALNVKDHAKTLELAETILKTDYVDINAHFCAYVAQRELGHADKAAYHRAIVDGLLKSIIGSGDGKSEETAYVVIATTEEYTLFRFLDLRPSGQALIQKNGHSYDRMTVVDPKTSETITLFFQIDKVFGWLNRSLKN